MKWRNWNLKKIAENKREDDLLINSITKYLIEIWDYTVEEWAENWAEKYYNLIISSCME